MANGVWLGNVAPAQEYWIERSKQCFAPPSYQIAANAKKGLSQCRPLEESVARPEGGDKELAVIQRFDDIRSVRQVAAHYDGSRCQ